MAGDNPDEKPPTGFDRTIRGQPTAETVAAPAPPVPPKSPFEKTITAPPIASAVTVASDSVPPSRPPSSRSGVGRSTVGNEMKGASIERFTPVEAGRFELLDELARGGLGRVFRARDPRTGRIVAIKEVLRPQQEIILRFAREALVTANLQHPSIVPVYEVGRWPSGEPFYAMKLVEGRTLDALIGEAKTQVQRLALLAHVIDVAEALAYAHGEHVIHRDLKPANVLVGSYGETVVIDWGLAKNLATGEEIEALPVASTIPPESGETIAGSVLGTPAYMPPEQAIGDKVDERADVYAIGAILYHALSGVRPFAQAKTLDELLELVVREKPAPLAELAPELPPELVAIVEHAMARDPAQRYPTAQGIAKDLRDFQAGKLVGAHEYTTWQLIRRWVGQHKAVVATAAIALGVLIVVGALGVWRITNERDEAQRQRGIAQTEREEARDARALAEKRFTESLQELARQALIAGDIAKALPLAAGALGGHDRAQSGGVFAEPHRTPVPLRVIAAQARASYAALVSVVPSPSYGVATGAAANDRFFTSSGGDETIRAWDMTNDRELWRKKGGYMLTASRDGVHLLTATNAGEVIVFAAADGTEVARWKLTSTDDVATSLVWSPDNVHFAAATDAGKIWLGALGGGAPRPLDGHATKVIVLEFSPDGSTLGSAADASNVVAVHDGRTGDVRMRITATNGEVSGLGWLDADHLVIGDRGSARSYDLRTRTVDMTLDHGAWVYGILVGGPPAKRWILTYGDGTTARLWDLATRTKIADLTGHNLAIEFAISVGDWLVTKDELGNGFVWDPRTGERVQILPRDTVVMGVDVVGDRLVVFGETRQEVWTFPPISGLVAAIRRIDEHTARIRQLVFQGNGVLWSSSNDGTVHRTVLDGSPSRVFGTAGYTERIRSRTDSDAKKPPYAHGMRSLEVSPDGETVVTTNEDGSLVAWDVATAKPRTKFEGHTGRVRDIAFTADRGTMYSVGDSTVRRWDVATGKQTAVADLGVTGWDVAVFPDGTVATLGDESPAPLALWTPLLEKKPVVLEPVFTHELVIAGDRLLVSTFSQVYQLDSTGSIKANAPQPKVFTTSIAMGPKGPTWFVAGDPRGDIVLHDWETAATIRSWTAGDGIVTNVAFSPRGELVASISDNRVRIWDPNTGALLAATVQLPTELTQLAWSADGKRLAIAGGIGTVWVWEVHPDAVLLRFEKLAGCASPWTLADATLTKITDAKSCRP